MTFRSPICSPVLSLIPHESNDNRPVCSSSFVPCSHVAVLHQRGDAGRSDFLIELRCALWVSPPNITAFVLPALECRSVCAALLRPAHVPGSCMASASQLMVSALWRRKGVGSLAHRAGTAVACGSAWHRVCAAGQRMQVQINSIPVCCKPIKFILVVFKLKPAAIWAKED